MQKQNAANSNHKEEKQEEEMGEYAFIRTCKLCTNDYQGRINMVDQITSHS